MHTKVSKFPSNTQRLQRRNRFNAHVLLTYVSLFSAQRNPPKWVTKSMEFQRELGVICESRRHTRLPAQKAPCQRECLANRGRSSPRRLVTKMKRYFTCRHRRGQARGCWSLLKLRRCDPDQASPSVKIKDFKSCRCEVEQVQGLIRDLLGKNIQALTAFHTAGPLAYRHL